jgi:Ca-activated chloride channel family protein
MSFLWPNLLLLLGLIPLIVGIYIWMLRRRRRFAIHFSSLSIIRAAIPRRAKIRRHIPFVLFLIALTSLIVALGRPVAIITVPISQATIILTLDVSGSMRSRDIQPSRLDAAEAAAISFIQNQKPNTQIGIVAFAGFAEELQSPTNDQEALQSVIESLTTGRRTAVGSGILKAIDAIAEVDKSIAPSVTDTKPGIQPTPVPQGDYAPDIIVVLTDGVSNAGPLPLDAAKQAADRGVRVYTIEYGTTNGVIPDGQNGGGGGQGFGFGRGGFRAGTDENSLKQIASMTGGTYYKAESAEQLNSVFQNLPTYLITKHEIQEISVLFAAIGILLAVMAVIFSLVWNPLP